MRQSHRRWPVVCVLAALCLMPGPMSAVAQVGTAAAGNGGTADCAASGGAVATGRINSGANAGSAIGVGDTWGDVAVDGGAMAASTDLGIAAAGGTGICDAAGGDENGAFTLDPVPASAPVPDPGLEPAPDPMPPVPPVPPTPEPVEPFQVCVALFGGANICGPGACDTASGIGSCTLVDCSGLPGSPQSPCTLPNCTVEGNTGTCTLLL